MPQLLHNLALLAALRSIAVIALSSLTLNTDDELTAYQARVLCSAMKAIENVAIVYGTTLAAQDTPLTLLAKAVTLLLG